MRFEKDWRQQHWKLNERLSNTFQLRFQRIIICPTDREAANQLANDAQQPDDELNLSPEIAANDDQVAVTRVNSDSNVSPLVDLIFQMERAAFNYAL